MLYLVGLKKNAEQDCIYEISGDSVKRVICADSYDWHPNVLGVYGTEIGSKIIDIIENLDFKRLRGKKKERILSIIDKHYQQRGCVIADEDDALDYGVFEIGDTKIPGGGVSVFKETSTLC